jgi:UTP--glucose-1-phosphate uridylyltransferase
MAGELQTEFGDLLRRARERAALSRDQLARRVGLDASHLFRIETGDRKPSRDAVLALVEGLELDDPTANQWLVTAGYAPVPMIGAVRGAIRARGVRTRGAVRTRTREAPGADAWDSAARARRLESIGLTESVITRLLRALESASLAEQQLAAEEISRALARVTEALEGPVRSAVIPAAGGQHRLLAAHVIQRLLLGAIGEAAQAGIRNVVLVLAPGNDEYLFTPLKEAFGVGAAPAVRLESCEQAHPEGLGDAILRAKSTLSGGPFAVLLPDDVVRERAGRIVNRDLRRMIEVLRAHPEANLVAVTAVGKTRLSSGGAAKLAGKEMTSNVYPILQLVEKPDPAEPICSARNVFGIVGRYVLQPAVFGALEELKGQGKRPLELTDAVEALRDTGAAVYAYDMEGKRRDVGAVLGEAEELIGGGSR